ncbi:unnamed protein product, partial [Brassica oleracea]
MSLTILFGAVKAMNHLKTRSEKMNEDCVIAPLEFPVPG